MPTRNVYTDLCQARSRALDRGRLALRACAAMKRGLALLGLLAACGGNSASSTFDSAHVAVAIVPHFSAPPRLPRPDSLSGWLSLDVAADGTAAGSLAISGSPTSISEVAGHVADGRLTLAPGQIAVEPGGTLAWQTLTLAVGPAGLVGSSGSATGTWTTVGGDQIDMADYKADLSASADTKGEPFDVIPPEARPPDAVLPTDALQIRLGEPAEVGRATAVQVLANGMPVADSLTPLADPVHGLVIALALRPPGFWAFDTAITAEPGGLVDPSGNAMPWSGAGLHVVADPGPVTGNLGFEAGTAGWIVTGHQAGTTGAFDGVVPVEGALQMIVHEESALTGYLDVPAGATSLSLSVGLFSEAGQFDADRTAVIALHRASGERIVIFDGYAERAASVACACGDFGQLIPPTRKSVDVTMLRGERLFLTAEVRSSFFIGVNFFALVLDDLRIQ